MIRECLLYVAGSRRIARFVQRQRFMRSASRRFVAGETLDEALRAVSDLTARGISATIAYAGEHAPNAAQARAASALYGEALRRIAAQRLCANISVKLTQLGLDIGDAECKERLEEILQEASRLGNFVRIDMESSAYTGRILEICTHAFSRHYPVGLVIQAYLHRSGDDVQALLSLGIRVRLCKGAYRENSAVAFQRKKDVDANFMRLATLLLESDGGHAIATHDKKIIAAIQALAAQKSIPKSAFEFQMLYGIRPDLQQQLVQEGYAVRVYVPFGEEWFGYFMRRLAERPANLLFFLRQVFTLR